MDSIPEALSHSQNPISIDFSAKERAGMQTLLDFYADCVLVGVPPCPARRKELSALSRLRAKLSLLETMQDGERIEIDVASLLIVRHACMFFLAGADLLPFGEQVRAVVRAAAAEIKGMMLEGQQ